MSGNIDQGERVTRKPHRCAYCDDQIPAGTRVAWWKWADAGQIETSYGHLECRDADHWDATLTGRRHDEELTDPGDFYREVLPAYREHLAAPVVSATGLVGADPAGSPQDGGLDHGGDR